MLQKVAEILRLNTNVEDMVCRYGGDEFLILIECDKDIGDEIILRVDRLLQNITRSSAIIRYTSVTDFFVADPTGIIMEGLCIR